MLEDRERQPGARNYNGPMQPLRLLIVSNAALRRCRTLHEAKPHGFTLIEVMVVIVILGILAALVVPRVLSRPDEARVIAAKQDLMVIGQALKLYRLDNQRYPSAEQGRSALIARPEIAPLPSNWKTGGYIERLPKDPWGNGYVYVNPGLHGEIDILSLGADGRPGGEGLDADIGSWQ